MFLNTLTQKERETLRIAVKRVHMTHFPDFMLTDYEADKIIEAQGPETAEMLIKAGIDNGLRDR